jgi:hypothetical protein
MTGKQPSPSAVRADTQEHADRLKERVYITFTTLAVVLALRGHGESSAEAATTFAIVVAGSLLASAVSDVVSHIAVHAALPSRTELRRLARVSTSALYALAVPFVFIALALVGAWTVDRALRASSIALVASLVAVGYLAARRARLPLLYRLLVLFLEFAIGVIVILLELLAHV